MHPKTIFEHFTLKVCKSKSSQTYLLVFKFSSCVDAPHTLTSSKHAKQEYIFAQHTHRSIWIDYSDKMQQIQFCILTWHLKLPVWTGLDVVAIKHTNNWLLHFKVLLYFKGGKGLERGVTAKLLRSEESSVRNRISL